MPQPLEHSAGVFGTPREDAGDPLDQALTAQLTRAGAGDRAAFAELYDLASARVFGLVSRVLGDEEAAERICAEVFVEVWRTAPAFRGGGGGLAWVLGVAHRRSVDHVRTRRPVAPSRVTGDPTPSDCDPALGLAYFDGLTAREVASVLGLDLATAHDRLRSALVLLPGRLAA